MIKYVKNPFENGKLVTMGNKYFIVCVIIITGAIGWVACKIFIVQQTIEQGEIEVGMERLTIDHNHKQARIYDYYNFVKRDSTDSNPNAIIGFKRCDSIISIYKKITILMSEIEKVDDVNSSESLFKEISKLTETLDKGIDNRPNLKFGLTGDHLLEEYLLYSNEYTRELCRLSFMNEIDELADQRLLSMVAICKTPCIIPK